MSIYPFQKFVINWPESYFVLNNKCDEQVFFKWRVDIIITVDDVDWKF